MMDTVLSTFAFGCSTFDLFLAPRAEVIAAHKGKLSPDASEPLAAYERIGLLDLRLKARSDLAGTHASNLAFSLGDAARHVTFRNLFFLATGIRGAPTTSGDKNCLHDVRVTGNAFVYGQNSWAVDLETTLGTGRGSAKPVTVDGNYFVGNSFGSINVKSSRGDISENYLAFNSLHFRRGYAIKTQSGRVLWNAG